MDVVLSKGLIDAMFHANDADCAARMAQLLREASATLAPGGTFLMVSLLQRHIQELIQAHAAEAPGFASFRVVPLLPPTPGELRPFMLELRRSGGGAAAAVPGGLELGFQAAVERLDGGLALGAALDGEDPPASDGVDGWEGLWARVGAAQEAFTGYKEATPAGGSGDAAAGGGKKTICSMVLDFMPCTYTFDTDLEGLRFQLLQLAAQRQRRAEADRLGTPGFLGWSAVKIEPLAFGLKKLVATALLDPEVSQPEDLVGALSALFLSPEDDDEDEYESDDEGAGDAGEMDAAAAGASSGGLFVVQKVSSITMVDVKFGEIAGAG
uniref:Uncharacterized protein n=1 Tax=Phaeomonas parva TaxID=124430 RepID=A0A6U4CT28_9STRA